MAGDNFFQFVHQSRLNIPPVNFENTIKNNMEIRKVDYTHNPPLSDGRYNLFLIMGDAYVIEIVLKLRYLLCQCKQNFFDI